VRRASGPADGRGAAGSPGGVVWAGEREGESESSAAARTRCRRTLQCRLRLAGAVPTG